MKIAVPTRGNQVDDHFGHCEMYTVFTMDEKNKSILNTEILPSPQGCGCKSNIASTLKEKGVTMLLAGNMGNGALNVLKNSGIEVIRGCSGDVRILAETYMKDALTDSGESCNHHGDSNNEGHQCHNHA